MKEWFAGWNPSIGSRVLLVRISEVLKEYRQLGYRLTLRQLYYQLVSRDVIPNTVRSYGKLGNVVNRGRLAGLIDWSMIEDRVRIPVSNSHWSDPKDILKAAADSYYRSRWEDQDTYLEVWSEKDAVSNIIQPVCAKWDVTFQANRGYSSQTAMYDGYKRFLEKMDEGKSVHLIYLGDHDPSGIDMTRDIADRIELFMSTEFDVRRQIVQRLALNMDQIEQYSPPENPAKMTDSRFEGYAAEYGTSSWELDALEPTVLAELVENKILEYVDHDEFERVEKIENGHKEQIRKLSEHLAE